MRRVLLLLGAAALAGVAGGAQAASSTFPGANGRIVFVRERPSFSDELAGIFHTDLWWVVPGRRARPLLQRRQYDATPYEPDWSADGQRLAVAMDCSNKYALGCSYVAVANANGRGLRELFPPASGPGRPMEASPAWSPDGTRIAFVSYAGQSGIFVMAADGRGRTRITAGTNPAWSPDGAQLALERSGDIWVVNLAGDGPDRNITNTPFAEANPSWSPDGTQIAYDRVERTRQRFVYSTRSDGTEPRRLALGRTPAWSPDGRRIVFVRRFNIWLMNADGTRQRRLTKNRIYEAEPAWQPIPR